MKKIIALILVLLFVLSLCACSSNGNTGETQESETQLHQIASPKQDNAVEWCKIDANVSVADMEETPILAEGDFDSFALLGVDNESSFIQVKLSEIGKEVLKKYLETVGETTLSFNIDNEPVAYFTIDANGANEDLKIGQEVSYQDLCDYATKLRGIEK